MNKRAWPKPANMKDLGAHPWMSSWQQTKKLEFNSKFTAIVTHFSVVETESTLQAALNQVLQVPVLGVLIIGEQKAAAMVSVGSQEWLTKLTAHRRVKIHNHLTRIRATGPFRAACVHISNLPRQATPDRVEAMLTAWHMPPLFSVIPRDNTGQAVGYGFITYRHPAQAEEVIQLNGKKHIKRNFIVFQQANPRKKNNT